jgi:hypothetical protein
MLKDGCSFIRKREMRIVYLVSLFLFLFSCGKDFEYEIKSNDLPIYRIEGSWEMGQSPELLVMKIIPNEQDMNDPLISVDSDLAVHIISDSVQYDLELNQNNRYVNSSINSVSEQKYTLRIVENEREILSYDFFFPSAPQVKLINLNNTVSLSTFNAELISTSSEDLAYWRLYGCESLYRVIRSYGQEAVKDRWTKQDEIPHINLSIDKWYPINTYSSHCFYFFNRNDVVDGEAYYRWNKTNDVFKHSHNITMFDNNHVHGIFIPYVKKIVSLDIKEDTIPFLSITNKSPDKISGYRIISTSYSDRRYYESFKDIDSIEYTKNELVRMFILPTLPSPIEGLRDQVPGIEIEITPFHFDEATGIETSLPPIKHTIGENYEVITLE